MVRLSKTYWERNTPHVFNGQPKTDIVDDKCGGWGEEKGRLNVLVAWQENGNGDGYLLSALGP